MSELRQGHLENDPQALSEAQLRQLYDEEEVERFMSLFSAVRSTSRYTPLAQTPPSMSQK